LTDAVIIGGGLAGLSSALALAECGLKVLVLERNGSLGGRASSSQDARTGDTVDIGPHIFHSEYHNMLALLEQLGTRDLVTWQPNKVLTLASQPRNVVLRHWPLPPPLSLLPSLLVAPGLGVSDYLSMIRTTWFAMQFGEEDVSALDQMSALEFLKEKGVSEAMINWWWRFAAMVVTSVPLERCSAAALMRIHAQLSGHRGLHFGFAAVGLGELYIPRSVERIESAGGQILMQSEVHRLLGEDRFGGVELTDGTKIHARYCVSAIPPQDLQPLIPNHWQAHEGFTDLRKFEASPYISCYIWFDRVVATERFVSHLWSPSRLNYDFYDLSKIRRGWADRPSIVASNIIYSHRAHGMSDSEIIAATIEEMMEFAPEVGNARVLNSRVHRIPMAIPCPTVGTEICRPKADTPVPGLFLAGDWTQTALPCTMESAVRSGWLAAERVLATEGKPKRLARPVRECDGLSWLMRRARKVLAA
jgi:squalene-associated FAD-dependent desaturase